MAVAAQTPDRLIAFLHLLRANHGGDINVQAYVDEATEINLAVVPALPELSEELQKDPAAYESYKRVRALYDAAYALTGATAAARRSISSLSTADTAALAREFADQLEEKATERVAEAERRDLEQAE